MHHMQSIVFFQVHLDAGFCPNKLKNGTPEIAKINVGAEYTGIRAGKRPPLDMYHAWKSAFRGDNPSIDNISSLRHPMAHKSG